jgi:hypothetical protein
MTPNIQRPTSVPGELLCEMSTHNFEEYTGVYIFKIVLKLLEEYDAIIFVRLNSGLITFVVTVI